MQPQFCLKHKNGWEMDHPPFFEVDPKSDRVLRGRGASTL